jgi:hypothetical protein
MFFNWFSQRDETKVVVEISLQTPRQLFNTLDPSPFHERDLDSAAERYIVDSADESAPNKPVHLLIHLPENMITPATAEHFQDSVQRFFTFRAKEAKLHLRRCFREGRIALLVGFMFLLSCLMIRELILPLGDGFFYDFLAEGFLITGWVALWHPLDVFLYQWWPLLSRYRLLNKISQLSVEVTPSSSQTF